MFEKMFRDNMNDNTVQNQGSGSSGSIVRTERNDITDAAKQENSCHLSESEGMTQHALMMEEPRQHLLQNIHASSKVPPSSNCIADLSSTGAIHVGPVAQQHFDARYCNYGGRFGVDNDFGNSTSSELMNQAAASSQKIYPQSMRTDTSTLLADKVAAAGEVDQETAANSPDGERIIIEDQEDTVVAPYITHEADGTSIIQEPGSNYGYRDYSRIIPSSDVADSSNGGSHKHAGPVKSNFFPSKLYDILSRPEFSQIVSWCPHGRAWRVMKPLAFEQKVLSCYFRHSNHSSFMRQVNGWGFRRITRAGRDQNSYFHELFLRGLPHLLNRMSRMTLPDLQPRDEPDLYKVSKTFLLLEQGSVYTHTNTSLSIRHPINMPSRNNEHQQNNSTLPDQVIGRHAAIGANLNTAALINQESAALQHLELYQHQMHRQQYQHNGLLNAAGLNMALHPGIEGYPNITSSHRGTYMANSLLPLERTSALQNFGVNATNIVRYPPVHHNNTSLQRLSTAESYLDPPLSNKARAPLAIAKAHSKNDTRSMTKHFPSKLHEILSREDHQSYIAWSHSGKEWRVLKPNTFAKNIIPQYFQHDQYNSFMRQVNAWGFTRINFGPTTNYYTHEFFVRDRPDLCQQMRRQQRSSQGKATGAHQKQSTVRNQDSSGAGTEIENRLVEGQSEQQSRRITMDYANSCQREASV